jgi:uncharacterized protein
MKTRLNHLPPDKQREIEHIKTVLTTGFEKILVGGQQDWRRKGKILKVILFGSFARNDWVDEPHAGYQSDWDILVIVSHEKLITFRSYWPQAEERLLKDREVGRPVNIIVHTLEEVNHALIKGEYFWTDIAREGIELFQQSTDPLATPKQLTPAEAYEMTKDYYDIKSAAAVRYFKLADVSVREASQDSQWLLNAAFNLHQAVETSYACFLLARTLYLPRSHNLKFLRSLSEDIDKRLIPAWPREAKKENSRFELLKRAYVDARYSKHYKITIEQLDVLTNRAVGLQTIVLEICQERLRELQANI